MTEGAHGTATFYDLRTSNGEVLPEVTIAYTAKGSLAPGGRNAILLTHGGTNTHRVFDGPAEAGWNLLACPGGPIDTDRYFTICSNVLGGGYGSTNARSIDPRTGRPYGSRFPVLTIEDLVNAQMRMLATLGVTHLRAVVGPSYGGFQAFQWAVTAPDFIDGIVPVTSSIRPADFAHLNSLVAWFEADPNWNGGDYYETGGVRDTLIRFRIDTLRQFGAADALATRFPDAAARTAELYRMAEAWADCFDANSLIILGRTVDTYDVTPYLSRIRVPVLYVLSRSDPLYPPSQAPGVIAELRAAGVDVRYFEIDSDAGHLAPPIEAAKWAPALRDFIREL
jgi:homoserine O-acetyltransferase/O-succinyltransferase